MGGWQITVQFFQLSYMFELFHNKILGWRSLAGASQRCMSRLRGWEERQTWEQGSWGQVHAGVSTTCSSLTWVHQLMCWTRVHRNPGLPVYAGCPQLHPRRVLGSVWVAFLPLQEETRWCSQGNCVKGYKPGGVWREQTQGAKCEEAACRVLGKMGCGGCRPERRRLGRRRPLTPLLGLTQRSQATYLGRWGVLGRPSADPHSEQEVTSCVLALGF